MIMKRHKLIKWCWLVFLAFLNMAVIIADKNAKIEQSAPKKSIFSMCFIVLLIFYLLSHFELLSNVHLLVKSVIFHGRLPSIHHLTALKAILNLSVNDEGTYTPLRTYNSKPSAFYCKTMTFECCSTLFHPTSLKPLPYHLKLLQRYFFFI